MGSQRTLRLTEQGLAKLEEGIAKEGCSDYELAIKPPQMSVNTIYRIRRRGRGVTHSSIRKLYRKLGLSLTEADYESCPSCPGGDCPDTQMEDCLPDPETQNSGGLHAPPALIAGEVSTRRQARRRRKALVAVGLLIIAVIAVIGMTYSRLYGADPNALLVKAVENDDTQAARNLLAQGASVNAYRKSDFASALWIATNNGSDDMVRLLLNHHADVDWRSSPNGQFPLLRAAALGYSSIADILLENGAYIDERDRWGTTALVAAAKYNHVDIVRDLLDRGADKNATDVEGHTALWEAEQYKATPAAQVLITVGASRAYCPHFPPATVAGLSRPAKLDVPNVPDPLAIGEDAKSPSTWSRIPSIPLYLWNEEGDIAIENLRLAHDNRYLYFQVMHAYEPGQDSFMNLRLATTPAAVLTGSPTRPYGALLVSQGSPGSYPGYNACAALSGTVSLDLRDPPDVVSASWGTQQTGYDFRIPLADVGVRSARGASLFLLPVNGTDGHGYGELMPPWTSELDPSTWLDLKLQ